METPKLFVRRLALREWFLLFAFLLTVAATLGWQNGLGRLDQSRYDLFLSTNSKPARDDIIIVAIDDYSLSQLGRWPWPRTLHADLIRQLNKAKPRAIGLDIILSEPELPQANGSRSGDSQLAAALAQNGRTVLPVTMTNDEHGLTVGLPIPVLAHAAHALGHINLAHDSDGVVRSAFLREGQNGIWWPHFSEALLATGNPAGHAGASTPPIVAPRLNEFNTDGWQRAAQMHIPFAGNLGYFRSVPYVSVLRGEVPKEFFADKYVLVGATAQGMADAYPTAVSGTTGSMPGIEINAQILGSLLDGKSIRLAPGWLAALFTVTPVCLAMLGYLLLSPRLSLFAAALWALLAIALSYFSLRMGLWLAPSAAIIMVVISYPLWSWRRLEAAIAYLGQEFTRLDTEPHLLPEAQHAVASAQIADVLEQRISAMQNAARRVRDLRQFVSDTLQNLPDATIVTSIDGHVLLANKQADDYYLTLGFDNVRGMNVFTLLAQLRAPQPLGPHANISFDWPQLLDRKRRAALLNGVAAQDPNGLDLLVKSGPCYSASSLLTGWIISILDISTIRSAERSRDETLRFLSHDMRAPQASILALLELQNEASSALPQQEFFARIERASRKTLGLADNFVQLARAESHEYRLEEVDFQDILVDATDEMWSLTKSRHIAIEVDIQAGDYSVNVDRPLMTRALTNLLSNAINYSPDSTTILCSVWRDQSQIVCSIRDQGYGIAAADMDKLFHRFRHLASSNPARHEGVGLGLVFVKTVIERHQGEIRFASILGKGTTFTLTLPYCRAA